MLGSAGIYATSLLQSIPQRSIEKQGVSDESLVPSLGPCILKIEHVGYTYRGGKIALRDISFEVEKGAIVGLLGPNGAGKSTLLKIVCGLMTPTVGTVTVMGKHLAGGDKATKSHMCALLQQSPIEPNMRVREVLTLFSSFYAHPLPIDSLIDSLGLENKQDAFVRTLSGGQRQRVAFARALIGDPDILVLDEPTTGLDVSIRKELLVLISRLRESGRSIVLSTHLVEEAEQVCDKVIIVNDGEIFGCDTPANLVAAFGSKDRIEAVFDTALREEVLSSFPPTIVCKLSSSSDHPYTYDISGTNAEVMFRVLAEVTLSFQVSMLSARLFRAGLESAYLNLTGKRICL